MKYIMLLVCMFFISYSHAQITEGSFEGKKIIIKKVDQRTAFIRIDMSNTTERCIDADLVGILMKGKGKDYSGYLLSENAPADLKEEQLFTDKITVRFASNKIMVKTNNPGKDCVHDGDYKIDKK